MPFRTYYIEFLFKGKNITEFEQGFEPFEHSIANTPKDVIPYMTNMKPTLLAYMR
jgi:hypothetical protein